MILNCPGCAARFVVADSRIDPVMREVSHASCGTAWVLGEEPCVAADPVDYRPALRMAAPEPAHSYPDFDLDRLREQLTWATTLPKRRVAKFMAAASLSLAVSAELMLLFHEQIGHAWPTMAHLYTNFGL